MTKLPSPQRRLPDPPHLKRRRPKTYSVAVYLVVAVVVLQVGMLVYVFWLRAMVVPVNFQVPVARSNGIGLENHPSTAEGNPARNHSALPDLPSLTMTSNHAARLTIPTFSDKLEQIVRLNEQAQAMKHQNDLKSAADLLAKAEDIDPRNPDTLKSLAETSYLMNDSMRSKTYWQRLVDLGPNVGTIYGVAKDHVLLLASAPDGDALAEPSTLPRTIYIDQVEKTAVDTISGQPQFHVRTVLMRKDPKMGDFDQKKLRPFVIFYQQMPDGSLVPDLSQRKGAFEDTFLFWNNKLKEPFGVDYSMPLPGAPGPNGTTMGEYYGFVIGIYYNNILQDQRSEPTDLGDRMKLPEAIE